MAVLAVPDDCRGPGVAHVGADSIPAASVGVADASAVSVVSSTAVAVVGLGSAAAGVEMTFRSRSPLGLEVPLTPFSNPGCRWHPGPAS